VKELPDRNEVVREQLEQLGQDLRELWTAIVVDPKKQARKKRAWRILVGVSVSGATMGARKLATRLWKVLTGEDPPTAEQPRHTTR
jgi:uncharacterized protein DUF4235